MTEVFVWEMFKTGAGHASMFISGTHGKAYISWWPAASLGTKARALHGVTSAGLVHSMHRDKEEDGVPDWCSKPLTDLDEGKIIRWWKQIAVSPNLTTGQEPAKAGNYVFVSNNCSTTVLRALRVGASTPRLNQIDIYFNKTLLFGSTQNVGRFVEQLSNKVVASVGTGAAIKRSALEAAVGVCARGVVVAPYDCRNVIESVWT